MTTSTYLALATMEEIFTTTDLLAAGLRSILYIGRNAMAAYVPHDQPVSLNHPIVAYLEKQPANDNDKDADTLEAKPATAMTENNPAWRFAPGAFARLKPRLDHAHLKITHSEAAHGAIAAADRISIASRPLIEKLLSDKPMPKGKHPKLNPDFDVAV